MKLHENTELFEELLTAASQPEKQGGLGVRQAFLEKDYWVTRSLQMLAESRFAEQAVFKGGTSLSKACGVGFRFSEDIDIAIVSDDTRTDNQTKALVGGIGKAMSVGLNEVEMPDTRKFSKYRKVYYRYPELTGDVGAVAVKAGIIQLEVVSFANPYPYEKKRIGCLVRDFLLKVGREDMVEQYDLGDFELNVLDVRRTATEKLVSLIRQSLGNDYTGGLRSKIRHFYDLHYLWGDETCRNYLMSDHFKRDFGRLLAEDKARFKEPEGWQQKRIGDSPLLTGFNGLWQELSKVYEEELPGLAYRPVPDAAYRASFEAQVAMFPGMVKPSSLELKVDSLKSVEKVESGKSIQEYIDHYSKVPGVLAWKMPGAGGGGYLACVVSDASAFASAHPEAIRLTIRRPGM